MALVLKDLHLAVTAPVQIWVYETTDSAAVVTAPGYFDGAGFRKFRERAWVLVLIDGGGGAQTHLIMTVASVTASSVTMTTVPIGAGGSVIGGITPGTVPIFTANGNIQIPDTGTNNQFWFIGEDGAQRFVMYYGGNETAAIAAGPIYSFAPNGILDLVVGGDVRIGGVSVGSGGGVSSGPLLGPTFAATTQTYDPISHAGEHVRLDPSTNDVELALPDVATVPAGTHFYALNLSDSFLSSLRVIVPGQLRSNNGFDSHSISSDTVYFGLSQATSVRAGIYVWSDGARWNLDGLFRDGSAVDQSLPDNELPPSLPVITPASIDQSADLLLVWDNSDGQLKRLAWQNLFDLQVSRPVANFQIDANSPPATLFAPTGGALCTIAAMREGQIVPFRNKTAATYSFAASGVTLTPTAPTVGPGELVNIEAVSSTDIHVDPT